MPHQPLTAALVTNTTTGFHPGPAYYAEWVLIIGALISVPIYFVRRVRDRRRRR